MKKVIMIPAAKLTQTYGWEVYKAHSQNWVDTMRAQERNTFLKWLSVGNELTRN